MLEDLRELWRYRELLLTMVKRDLRVRYKNSFFGILWSFINPLMMTAVMTLVFTKFMGLKIHNYSAYYLAAYLPFSFIQAAILDSAQSVLAAQPVVKKVYFPRELLPIASVVGNFFHFILGLGVLFLFLTGVYLFNPGQFPIQPTVIYVPILLVITFCFTLGLSLLVSALNTFYEDVKYMVSMLLYMIYFLSPVMYFIEMVANSATVRHSPVILYKLYNLNPITTLCVAYRKTILAQINVPSSTNPNLSYPNIPIQWDYIWASGFTSLLLLVWGYHIFNKLKWRFMERP